MDSHIAVVVPTVKRDDAVARLLAALRAQTLQPDAVVLCAPETADVPQFEGDFPWLHIVRSPQGAARQRNAGVHSLPAAIDVVAFLDDDSIPRSDYLEHVREFFDQTSDAMALSGRVARDGAAEHTELPPSAIEAALAASWGEDAELPVAGERLNELYGCNMAVRRAVADAYPFDEALPLYSWLEDLDLARRLTKAHPGSIRKAPLCVVVHQGHKSGGRTSHRRLGYSSIANPAHLARKGSLTVPQAAFLGLKPMAANLVYSIKGPDRTDRLERLRGQLLAVADVCRGRITPERITTFDA